MRGHPSFADWGGVINYFTWSQGISGAVLTGVTTIKEDGDNYVYKVEQADGTRSVLKQYHSTSDVESRLDTQSKHLSILRDCGISCIPKPVWNQGSWAIYDYVPGEAPDPNDQKVIKQVSDFLAQLDTKGDELRKHNLPMADDARLTLASYVAAVNKLWAKVFSAAQAGHQDVMFFMMTDLEQLRQDNINHYYLWCKRKNWDKDHELDTKELIFSPVDFGLHNARLTPSGELVFLDLEHSGWDDPAKLLADFFYNTEQNLEMKHKLQVLDTFVKHRDWDKGFLNRFWAVSDIVAVEWILKTLAVVTKEEQKHLEATIPGLDYKAAVKQGLDEALAMREAYQPMEHLCKVDQLLGADEKIS